MYYPMTEEQIKSLIEEGSRRRKSMETNLDLAMENVKLKEEISELKSSNFLSENFINIMHKKLDYYLEENKKLKLKLGMETD
jgi:regulator of replication initiation timing